MPAEAFYNAEWKVLNDSIVNGDHEDFDKPRWAVEFAESEGCEEVWFADGPYEQSENDYIVMSEPGLTVRGFGKPRISTDASRTRTVYMNGRDQALIGMTVENVHEDRQAISVDGDNSLIHDCHIITGSTTRYGIRLLGDENRISDVDFSGSSNVGEEYIRIDGNGNSMTGCVGIESWDNRGADNAKSGNSPLDSQ